MWAHALTAARVHIPLQASCLSVPLFSGSELRPWSTAINWELVRDSDLSAIPDLLSQTLNFNKTLGDKGKGGVGKNWEFWVQHTYTMDMYVKSLSCVRLCNPMDCSLPGSWVHGILQARELEWVAISFSRGSSQPRDRTRVSRTAGRRFTVWATRRPQYYGYYV